MRLIESTDCSYVWIADHDGLPLEYAWESCCAVYVVGESESEVAGCLCNPRIGVVVNQSAEFAEIGVEGSHLRDSDHIVIAGIEMVPE